MFAVALGVFETGTLWPNVVVAMVMAVLALKGSIIVVKQSFDELNSHQALVAEEGQ